MPRNNDCYNSLFEVHIAPRSRVDQSCQLHYYVSSPLSQLWHNEGFGYSRKLCERNDNTDTTGWSEITESHLQGSTEYCTFRIGPTYIYRNTTELIFCPVLSVCSPTDSWGKNDSRQTKCNYPCWKVTWSFHLFQFVL